MSHSYIYCFGVASYKAREYCQVTVTSLNFPITLYVIYTVRHAAICNMLRRCDEMSGPYCVINNKPIELVDDQAVTGIVIPF